MNPRRRFLKQMISAGAGLLARPGSLLAASAIPPRVLADLHCHPLMDEWIRGSALGVAAGGLPKLISGQINQTKMTFEECHRAGVDLLCVAHYNLFDELATMPNDTNPDAPRQA